jgi:serine/threonine protein kinase/tetratricopeptide (TPR) repeat protein
MGAEPLSAERWQRLRALYDRVLDAPVDERAGVLKAMGDSHPDLHGELVALCEADAAPDSLLDRPVTQLWQSELARGTTLAGRFVLEDRLGSGGMGEVWRARDTLREEQVALKTIHRALAHDAQLLARFKREIQLASRVAHPNVCRVHELFEDRDSTPPRLFFTMALLEGETLAARLARAGALPFAEAMVTLREICAGLAAAHAVDVIHRDLKPANIILARRGDLTRAVITDFGLAKPDEAPRDGADATIAGTLLGTPAYMAPEQVAGRPAAPATDIYAVGLILFEMLRGERPFRGVSTLDSWMRRAREGPEALCGAVPGATPAVDRVLRRCLQYEPLERFQTPADLLRTVQRWELPRRWIWTAAAAVLAVTLVVSGMRLFNRERVRSAVAVSHTLLTPMTNGTGDRDLDALSEVLRSQLAQSPQFELVPAGDVRSALGQMHRPAEALTDPVVAREAALRTGAPAVVYATVTRLASDYSVGVRVEALGGSPASAARSESHTFTASNKGQIFDAVHDAAAWLRGRLGEPAATLAAQNRPPADTTSSSWAALRLLMQANETAAAGKTEDATLLLEEAIRFDPTFAAARQRLGDLLMSMRRDGEAFAAWKAALDQADRQQLTTRESLRLRSQFLEDTGDLAGAEKAYRTYLLHYPTDYRPTLFLGSVLVDRGRTAEALQWFAAAARLRPRDPVPPTHQARALLDLRRFDEAAAAIARVRAGGDLEMAAWLDGVAHFARGDLRGAVQAIEPLRASTNAQWVSRGFALRGSWLADGGDVPAALDELQRGIAHDAERGLRDSEADKWLSLAALQCDSGAAGACGRSALRGLATQPGADRVMRAGSLLAAAGQVAAAERQLRFFDGQPPVPRVQWARLRVEAAIAAARGRRSLARDLAERSAAMMPEREDRLFLARARAAAGERGGAEQIVADFLDHPVRAYFTPEPEAAGIWARARRLQSQLAAANGSRTASVRSSP